MSDNPYMAPRQLWKASYHLSPLQRFLLRLLVCVVIAVPSGIGLMYLMAWLFMQSMVRH